MAEIGFGQVFPDLHDPDVQGAKLPKRDQKKPSKPSAANIKAAPAKAVSSKAAPATKSKQAAPAKPVAAASRAEPPKAAKTKISVKKPKVTVPLSSIVLSPDYRPSEDEPFMNPKQRAYFRKKLLAWKEEIINQTKETLAGLHEDSTQHADIADRATSETDRALELRARDRQRKLVSKIDAALSRIEDGTYGYCEETGEPIGLKRLDARPIATLSVEAQERHERRERVYRED
jgi:DnaK suppressor protein